MTIALVIQLEDPKMWLVARGALDAARRQQISLRILGLPSESVYATLTADQLLKYFGPKALDCEGLAIASPGRALQDLALRLHREGKPVALLARRVADVPCVINNNTDAICTLVHSLVAKGHHSIAFLAGPGESIVGEERMSGYWQGLDECGLEVEESLLIRGDYSEQVAYEATKDALARDIRFTALIAVNDLSAFGAMRALAEAGMSPGADVEVSGFDNIPAAHWSQPPLSTFDTGLYQMGHEACTELCRMIRGEPFRPECVVPARFVPRLSTWESEGDSGRTQPLGADYLEHRFLYDSQLDLLQRDSHAAELLERLGQTSTSRESFLQTVRELLLEVDHLGLSPGCLYSLLGGSTGQVAPALGLVPRDILDAAVGLLTSAFLNEHTRQADTALRYHGATLHLRELPFAEAKETAIIEAMHRTVASLGIVRTGLFLAPSDDQGNAPRGVWYDWLSMAEGVRTPMSDEAYTPAWLEERQADRSWLTLPMLHGLESLGVVVVDAETDFLAHLPDLVRQFTLALRAARLQGALALANAELVETSRLAGLAEMATGVLHNIGNALNSVNTSCSLAIDLVRASKSPGVTRIARTLADKGPGLADFLAGDPKGAQVVPYLVQLGTHLDSEQKRMLAELEGLRGMIEHINEIVAAQQSHAQVSTLVEELSPLELLEFSLRLAEASLSRHRIRVSRDYADATNVRAQRQKVVQILTNLIRNAKEALDEVPEAERQLSLSVKPGRSGFVEIAVEDRGPGIEPANLVRIFNFGFTTKKGGHGYGLHNAALAAKEMGGALKAFSGGRGTGARFVLELPSA